MAAHEGGRRDSLATRRLDRESNDPDAMPAGPIIAAARRAPFSPACLLSTPERPQHAHRWRSPRTSALLLLWYLFVKFGDVPKFVMPSPGDTAATLGRSSYNGGATRW